VKVKVNRVPPCEHSEDVRERQQSEESTPSCKVKNNEKIEEQKKVSTIFTHQTPAQSRREESEESEEYEESGKKNSTRLMRVNAVHAIDDIRGRALTS
jgi:hypothetical protein